MKALASLKDFKIGQRLLTNPQSNYRYYVTNISDQKLELIIQDIERNYYCPVVSLPLHRNLLTLYYLDDIYHFNKDLQEIFE